MKLRTLAFAVIVASVAFSSCGNKTQEELQETTWSVTKITDENDDDTFPTATIQLYFGTNDSITLFKDVNTCNASYDIKSKSSIEFTGFGCTEACCDKAFADDVQSILSSANKYELDGSKLTISNGKTILFNKN